MTISNSRSRGVDGSEPARVLASTAASSSAWKARRISVLQANSRLKSARLRSASRAISVRAMSLQLRSLARSSAALTALERLEKSSNMGVTPSPKNIGAVDGRRKAVLCPSLMSTKSSCRQSPHAEERALARVSKYVFLAGSPSRRALGPPQGEVWSVRLGRQFARAFGGGGDRAREKFLNRLLAHEDLKRGSGDALRRCHSLPELARRKVGARQQLAGALDRRPCQLARKRGVESGGTARFFEAFGEQEDISGAAPRNCRDRIELRLVLDPHDVADRFEQDGAFERLVAGDGVIGARRRHAAPDGSGEVRHGAHDCGSRRQRARQRGKRPPRGDGKNDAPVNQGLELGQELVDEPGLDRNHDDGRRRRQVGGITGGNAVTRGERHDLGRRRRVLDKDGGGIEALPEPTFEQCPAHFTRTHKEQRAGEAEGHACPCVSSSVAASASSGDLPAHNTNWKA